MCIKKESSSCKRTKTRGTTFIPTSMGSQNITVGNNRLDLQIKVQSRSSKATFSTVQMRKPFSLGFSSLAHPHGYSSFSAHFTYILIISAS